MSITFGAFHSRFMSPPAERYQVRYGAEFGDYGKIEGPPESAGTWVRMLGSFSTPANQIDIYGSYVQGASSLPALVGVENVYFQAMPEPSTIVLLAGGLGMVLLVRIGRI